MPIVTVSNPRYPVTARAMAAAPMRQLSSALCLAREEGLLDGSGCGVSRLEGRKSELEEVVRWPRAVREPGGEDRDSSRNLAEHMLGRKESTASSRKEPIAVPPT